MVIQHKTCPWVKRRKYNDSVTDALTKLKAKVKALAEDFKRLSTAKKVAIILGMVTSIISGIIAAVKAGKRQKAEELLKNAKQKLNEAQAQIQESREKINRVISSNSASSPKVATAKNESREINTLERNLRTIQNSLSLRLWALSIPANLNRELSPRELQERRLAKKREAIQVAINGLDNKYQMFNSNAENNNYEPFNIKTRFKVISNKRTPVSHVTGMRHPKSMSAIINVANNGYDRQTSKQNNIIKRLKHELKEKIEEIRDRYTEQELIVIGNARKTHPGMVAYDELRNKDKIKQELTQDIKREITKQALIAKKEGVCARFLSTMYQVPIVGAALEIRSSGGDYRRFIHELARALGVDRHLERRYI